MSGTCLRKIPLKRRKKGTKIDIRLQVKALSTNKIYAGVKRRSYDYKNYRRKVFKLLEQYPPDVAMGGYLSMKMDCGFSSPLADLSNAIKATEDIIMEYYGLNDRHIVSINMRKYLVYKGDEFINVRIVKSRRKNVDLRRFYKRGEGICGM